MICQSCSHELEIFRRDNREIHVCPSCLSVLLPDEASVAALKEFSSEQILMKFVTSALDGSLTLHCQGVPAGANHPCPRCGSPMCKNDLNGKLKFYAVRCTGCNAIWASAAQAPLVTAALLPPGQDFERFKKIVEEMYALSARQRATRIQSFDELIAPYVVLSGMVPAMPLGDDNVIKYPPVTTRCLIVANSVIFVMQLIAPALTESWKLTNEAVLQHDQWYRLVTYAFLHANIAHLVGNMVFLNMFAKSVENELRPLKYLALYLLGAVVSGAFYLATTSDRTVGCVGASGAISAVIAAYLVLFPRSRLKFRLMHPATFQKIVDTQIPAIYYILFWFGYNLIMGALMTGSLKPGIAYWGHIGGFDAGILGAEAYKYLNLRQG